MDGKRLTLRLSDEEAAELEWLAEHRKSNLNGAVRFAISSAVSRARGTAITAQPPQAQPAARAEVQPRPKASWKNG